MGEVKIYLSDELDRRFRKAAMEAYGYGRGSISRAAEEAFLEWCRKREATRQTQDQTKATSSEKPLDNPPSIFQAKKEEQELEGAAELSSKPVSFQLK